MLALTIVFCSSYAYADYYIKTEKSGESFEEIMNYKTDAESVFAEIKSALTEFEKGADAEKIFGILDKYEDDFPLQTAQQLAKIKSSLENTAENNAEYTKIYNLYVDSYDIINRIVKGMAESDKYRPFLLEYFGMSDDELDEYTESMPTDREYALLKEISALTEEYYNAQSSVPNFGSYGEYLTYLKNMTEKNGEIFVKLVQKRNEIAKEHGYDNYADYAYAEIYGKDYTAEERSEFYRCTQKYISPLREKIYRICALSYDDYTETATESEIIADTRKYLEKINPELTQAFDYMTKHGLYDMKSSERKQTGCYTSYIDRFEVPFIFINPDGYDVRTALVHEYGHYTAEFHDPYYSGSAEYETSAENANIDIAEIQSQGLEILFYDYYGKIYGNSGKGKKAYSVYGMISSVIDAALLSEWQEAVYSTENLTVEKCNSLFGQYCEKYGVDSVYPCNKYGGYLWVIVNHNFEAPMYYISYGVSAMAALQILEMCETDKASAIDKYMRLSSMGEYTGFKSALAKCGFDNVFAESTFSETADSILDYCGAGFRDVTEDDPYFSYIVIADGYLGSEYPQDIFSPSDAVSRKDFAVSFGKITEDIDGAEVFETPFSDIDDKYISWAAENKIAAGTGNSYFGGDLSLTREQAVCFIYRFAGCPKSNGSPSAKFSDADQISDWAEEAVAWAEATGIILGYEDGCFYPQKNLSRAEAAVLVAMTYINYPSLRNFSY